MVIENDNRENQVGLYTMLTNSYCLVGVGAPERLYTKLCESLINTIIVSTTIGGSSLVGKLVVGNSIGLLVPCITTDVEMKHLIDSLPIDIIVNRAEDSYTALGEVIACNDFVALVHPRLSDSIQKLVEDTLFSQVFRGVVAGNESVGSYAVLSNRGGLVHPKTSEGEREELSSRLSIPISSGTLNRGSDFLSEGLIVNNWYGMCGKDTTRKEMDAVERAFRLHCGCKSLSQEVHYSQSVHPSYPTPFEYSPRPDSPIPDR